MNEKEIMDKTISAIDKAFGSAQIELDTLKAENKQQADFLSLAKEEMDTLQAENKNWEARYIEAVNDMATLKREIAEFEQALKGK
jgi:chromosome segregation ATPase